MNMEFDLLGVYAPRSDHPLVVESAVVDIFSQKLWVRNPNIYGRKEDNKFTPPHNKTIELTMRDHEGNTYKTTISVRELQINTEEREPEE